MTDEPKLGEVVGKVAWFIYVKFATNKIADY